jgi:Fe-Mn family superoxide dismutase
MNRLDPVMRERARLPVGGARSRAGTGAAQPFELPELPYGYGDLEPIVDRETMALHHDKHHRAYVAGLNAALAAYPLPRSSSLEALLGDGTALPADTRVNVHNMGGGHYNHSLFWQSLSPRGTSPGADLRRALDSAFGSFDAFQRAFEAAGAKQFGSGWVYLVANPALDFGLEIMTFANQDTPLDAGRVAIAACDVWEHAYYLKYRNRRAEWLHAWWDIVDWSAAEARLERAAGRAP